MKLAVVFPGIGYHADKPLLYYSKKLAAQAGWQVVEVAYGAFPDRVKGDRAKMEESFRIAMEGAETINPAMSAKNLRLRAGL